MVKPYATRSPRGRVAASVPVMTSEVASTRDGRDVTRPFVQGLQQPRDPRILGAVDWGVYDRILQDDQVYSTVQQRRTAVVSRNWNVLPGDDKDPRSVEAADRFSETLTRIGWDRITSKMLMAIYYGYAVAEIIWQPRDGMLDFGAIKVRHARRFRYTDKGELRLLTRTATQGEELPARKFWAFATGGSDDDEMYGRGLAEWLYWPVLFKRNGLRFWNTFLDKFGAPTAIGKYRPGTPRGDIEKLLATLQAIATDSGVAVPEGMAIELLQATRSGTADYATLCRYMDGAIAKVVLSQTMTTDDGSSKSQSETHAGVKLEVIKSDADLLSDSFNGDDGPARWWTDVNYGPDVAAPIVHRDCEEEADTMAEAKTDQVLKGLGWERDDESFSQTYGEGYRRVAQPEPATLPGKDKPIAANDADPDPDEDDDAGEKGKTASFAANDRRPLYVHRKLLNTADLIDWAKAQGFTSTIAADDLHVTVAYSKTPVDWMKMGGFWGWTGDNGTHLVPPGGPRLIERFGENAVVLVFFSGHLEQRHREMREAGASWDHAGYYPHVTISYDAGDIDLARIEPYRGELRFGPEIFEPIVEDWQAQIREASFAAPAGPTMRADGELDDVQPDIADDDNDELVDRLIVESGYRAAKTLTDPMLGTIRTANSAEELLALLNAAPADERDLAQSIENAGVAMRLDIEAREPSDG